MAAAIVIILFLVFCCGVVAIYKKITNVTDAVGSLNPLKRKGHLVPIVRMLERDGFFAHPTFKTPLVVIENEFISNMIATAAEDPAFAWELPRYELTVREFPDHPDYAYQLCSRSHAIGFNWRHK